MAAVPDGRLDPHGAADQSGHPEAPPPDLIVGETRPPLWRRGWAALPRTARRLVAVGAGLVLVGAGGLWLQERAAERALAERVDLAASLGISSDSGSPPGGHVTFFVVVRNQGVLPLSVTSVEAAGDGLRLQMEEDGDRSVPAGADAVIPMSVRLSCAGSAGEAVLRAEIGVRREDGGAATRQVDVERADRLRDVATTLCSVRPDLRDHELSVPVRRRP